jgi:ribonuclease E
MTKKMLIDSTHDEETRVAVVDGRKLVEFDYESKFRKPLKGSIFLAKVTRVEPSLQAAFVNFGGNRHGFLPFSEIHPDYFRIPIADREALLAEQQAMIEEQEAHEREREAQEREEQNEEGGPQEDHEDAGSLQDEEPQEDNVEYLEGDHDEVEEIGGDDALAASVQDIAGPEKEEISEDNQEPGHDEGHGHGDVAAGEPGEHQGQLPDHDEDHLIESAEGDEGGEIEAGPGEGEAQDGESPENGREDGRGGRGRYPRRGGRGRNNGRGGGRGRHRMAHRSNRVERFGGEEYSQEDRFRFNLRRKYKIQEVIKRGQIMLVQVSKEERGNKGAAVSTYLSLPGRYCVLMPNSPRAGGVSRKIANYQDRARMKEIMQEITVPTGMSVIVRTAGVSRTKPEINRDLDYLMRLWDNIRELTLQSSAPAKVYEEADLIKRAVRDLYGKDIEEIVVAGAEGYKTARNFMKMMIPSHVKNVVEHTDDVPLFTRYHVEEQIAEIGEARVTLPSGGYLIINQTEALVAVDVNSGKATKERHIEETALKTNMEAASEIARQLRLRDLGGLVVIDFIDMEDRRNNAKVERRVRDALSGDRARIQMSRISSFGLMELSRQRLNPSLTESQFETCPHCAGLGRIRTSDAMSILVLRAIEAEGMKGRSGQIIAHVSNDVAVYILNNKRKNVSQIETRYDLTVLIRVDETVGASSFRIEAVKGAGGGTQDDEPAPRENARNKKPMPQDDSDEGIVHDSGAYDDDESYDSAQEERAARGAPDEEGRERNGRRRGRRGGRNRGGRGRREFRDRDDTNQLRDSETALASGNTREEQPYPGEDDEFADAALHQASHDRLVDQRESRDRDGTVGARGRRPEHRPGEGRNRGGRGHDRSGRNGRNEGRSQGRHESRNDRPEGGRSSYQRRDTGNAMPQAGNVATEVAQTFISPEKPAAAQIARAEAVPELKKAQEPKPAPVPRTYEKKDYETLNPEPAQKKKGWWNRLTD